MSIYSFFHFSGFLCFFLAFTYNKRHPPVFGAAPAFWCILLSFFGLSFSHILNNLSNYNVLTANAPFLYQIASSWSNQEGSVLSWCRILSFFRFLLCYRGRPKSHNVSKRGGHRETLFDSFPSNFVKNSILSLPRYEQKSGTQPQLYTPFVRRTLVDSELRSRRNRTFDGPALFYAPLYPERKMSFAPLGARRSRGSREGKRTHPLLHLARDDKERASFIDEQRALFISLFFFWFLWRLSDPFFVPVHNFHFFVRTEPLAESNPVPQDPISTIHPPCILAGYITSAIVFDLCRSKMIHRIVALRSTLMRKDDDEKNSRSVGCVGSRITSKLFTLKFNVMLRQMVAKCALLLRRNRSLLMQLWRRFFAFSSLWTQALVDTGREQAKCVVPNEKKDTTTAPLCWIENPLEVVSDQDQKEIRILILTCRLFLTVGIFPGSWWAHHELGRGGWWFRDPVENASLIPRVLGNICIHSVFLPLLHDLTLFCALSLFCTSFLGMLSVREWLLESSVHNFVSTNKRKGMILVGFFLLMTSIFWILFSKMKQQASVYRTYKREMVVVRSTLVHLRHSTRVQARPLLSQWGTAGSASTTKERIH